MKKLIEHLGVYDAHIDFFENQYPVPEGITYNSYLINSPLPVIMDTADSRMSRQWLHNLHHGLQGRTPGILVCLHVEPDHSGTIAEALEQYPDLQVVASAKGLEILKAFLPDASILEGRSATVGDGSVLNLQDDFKLHFITTPMVHWPEVLMAYEAKSGVLFSADAFGTFGKGDKQPTPNEWAAEAARYYYNICGKYGPQVQTALRKVAVLPGPVNAILPLHGPILDRDIDSYIAYYDKWSRYEEDLQGVVIAYASIYGHTTHAAEVLAKMVEARGQRVTLIDLARTDVSYALTQVMRHGATAFCASSYDAGVFPPMYQLLHHLGMKGYRNRTVGLLQNGSWAPTAARVMEQMLSTMKDINIVQPTVTIRSSVHPDNYTPMEALADALVAD